MFSGSPRSGVEDTWNIASGQRTLFVVPLEFSSREASEVVALDLFEHAAGVPVTEAMVADRIAELSAHPPASVCSDSR